MSPGAIATGMKTSPSLSPLRMGPPEPTGLGIDLSDEERLTGLNLGNVVEKKYAGRLLTLRVIFLQTWMIEWLVLGR